MHTATATMIAIMNKGHWWLIAAQMAMLVVCSILPIAAGNDVIASKRILYEPVSCIASRKKSE
jgi:hypothetical protein